MNSVVLRTVVPILLLIGAGFSSRFFKLLKKGDEKVLSSYIFFFALPALLFVNMSRIPFSLDTLRFVIASVLPHAIALTVLISLYRILKFSRDTLYLLIMCTVFGSHTFFGLPFIMFAFETPEAERLAVLGSSFMAISCVSVTITILESYKVRGAAFMDAIFKVAVKLSKNPLIIAIFSGLAFSALGITIPVPLSRPLQMLGTTAATVAIFQLGASLYGRKYPNLKTALKLALLRAFFLPTAALIITYLFKMGTMESSVIVLMHATPMALATIVLTERYNFHTELIPSLMLISSLAASIYMNVWLLLLGFH